jgi:glycosyltransferase involved in cell wall biosynthesis
MTLDDLPHILAVALVPLAAVQIVYWGIVLYRIQRTIARVPRASAGVAMAAKSPPSGSVCVVIPGHNEETAIVPLVRSLRAIEYPHVRFVLALDRCTDKTAELARTEIGADQRFEIFEITSCPKDWAGKVNAVWTAVNGAASPRDAEYLLFADADTMFHPASVAATLALMREREIDFLSLVSTLTHDRSFEWIAQPAAGMELFRQYPLIHANKRENRRAFANGQFMLFKAQAYRALGGHEAVKDELLEDLGLAELAARRNVPAGVFVADGMVRCRMYESWEQFRRGWKRIYTESSHRKVSRLHRYAAGQALAGCVLPVAVFVFTLAVLVARPEEQLSWGLGLAAITLRLAVLLRIYAWGGTPLGAVVFNWLGAWIVAGILGEAASDLKAGRPTVWGGREYHRQAR